MNSNDNVFELVEGFLMKTLAAIGACNAADQKAWESDIDLTAGA